MADKEKYLGFSKATFYRKRKRVEENQAARNAIFKENAAFGCQSKIVSLSNQANPESLTSSSNAGRFIWSRNEESVSFSKPDKQGLPDSTLLVGINSCAPLPSTSTTTDCNLEIEARACSPTPVTCGDHSLTFPETSTRVELEQRRSNFNLNGKPAILEICKLASRHSITDECLEDILQLLHNPSVLCNRKDVPKTSRSFEILTGVSDMIITVMWQCYSCKLVQKKRMFQNDDAPNLSCCGLKFTYHDDHYIIFDGSQVLGLVLMSIDDGFADKTSDGSVINLTLNTDGAPLFKGSKSSFWPVLGAVDNTYYKTRKENIILLGIYVGINKSTKPDFDVFLEPIVESLKHLNADGLEWIRSNGTKMHSVVKVKSVLCDSIARPCVQKLTQFNGRFGCGYCYHDQPGPFFNHVDQSQIKWRDNPNYCLDVIGTICNEEDVRGVKGQCPLWNLSDFDMIYGFPPDVMHTVYLGVTRHLLEAWTNTSNFKMPFYLDQSKQRTINKMLEKIKPPQRVSRTPRTLDHLKHFKAHEFMMFLLYYSPAILDTVLERRYFEHWMKLVRGIAILTSSVVSTESISLAETILNEFSNEIKSLYGEKHQRFNIHLLLHLSEFVRRNGPLQNYSMAVFESFNMVLQKYVTSSNGVGRQICKRYFRDIVVKSSEANSKATESNDVVFQPLNSVEYQPSVEEAVQLRLSDMLDTGFTFFSRVKVINYKSSIVLHSEMYTKSSTRDSTCFVLEENHYIFKTKVFAVNELSKKCYAVGNCMKVCPSNLYTLPHCFDVVSSISIVVEVPANPEIVFHTTKDTGSIFFKFLNDAEAISE